MKSNFSKSVRLVAFALVMIIVVSVIACNENSVGDGQPTGSALATSTLSPTPVPTSTPITYPDEQLTLVVTEETISQLEQYPNLKKVDLTGSLCYDAILTYVQSHPQIQVIYTISIGATEVSSDTQSLSLSDTDFDYETLKKNLKYLPNVTAVAFNKTGMTSGQIEALKVEYPEVSVTYTKANNQTQTPTTPTTPTITDTRIELDPTWTVHDWTSIGSDQIETAIADAQALSGTSVVKLSSSLSKGDVKRLQAAAPNVIFEYTFTLYGKELSTLSKTVSYVNADIGDSGETAIREALDILTKCTYFKLDNCKLSNEILAGIRDSYAGRTEIVWRIYHYHSGRSWLTDTTVLRAVYHVDDTNSGLFKYLTKVKYVDLGHNTSMVDLSFLGYMPDLELAILSGSPIKDLSPLVNCKKLDFLELAWCGHLTDVSPLAQCTSLRFLNLGFTRVSDLSPLKNLPLEQFSYINSGKYPGLTTEYWEQVKAWLPNCWITCDPMNAYYDNGETASPYSVGWRYKANGGGYTDCYKKVRIVFNLDYVDSLIAGGAK